MGLALLGGMVLARSRRYRAHMWCQSSVLLLNLPLIALIMFPSFRDQIQPQIPGRLDSSYYAVATVHAIIGTVAEVLGLYIILVAATSLIPARFRFSRWKVWMRTELTLWWVVVFIGIGVYYVWYLAPSTSASTGLKHGSVAVKALNFQFQPKAITVKPGTTVVWLNTQGSHEVVADRGEFQSSALTPGQSYAHTFTHPGTYSYYCAFHGGKGGLGMSGKIVVKARTKP